MTQNEQIIQAINSLPPKQREVALYLQDAEGALPASYMAKRLGISSNNLTGTLWHLRQKGIAQSYKDKGQREARWHISMDITEQPPVKEVKKKITNKSLRGQMSARIRELKATIRNAKRELDALQKAYDFM